MLLNARLGRERIMIKLRVIAPVLDRGPVVVGTARIPGDEVCVEHGGKQAKTGGDGGGKQVETLVFHGFAGGSFWRGSTWKSVKRLIDLTSTRRALEKAD